MQHTNNYTIARGKIFLARETNFDVFDNAGERYTGNSPGLSVSVESTQVDHFNSDGGVSELDASVTTQVNRSGTVTFDDISAENLELFFLGQTATILQSATPVTGEVLKSVLPGLYYQLGATRDNPQGVRDVATVTLKDGSTTYAENVDFEVDHLAGRVYIVPGGAIPAGTNPTVGYTPVASTRERVISGNKPTRGRLRYIEDNPAGKNRTFLFPLVEITPNGDFDLKGDTWRQMPFNLRVLKRGQMAAVYIDGIPQATA